VLQIFELEIRLTFCHKIIASFCRIACADARRLPARRGYLNKFCDLLDATLNLEISIVNPAEWVLGKVVGIRLVIDKTIRLDTIIVIVCR
jgi:hypothetical protein